MPPKGINGRANMQKFQMNSKKYGGNPFKYTSLVSSVGRASKGGMWNYIQRRTAPQKQATPGEFAGGLTDLNFNKAIDWWLAGGSYRDKVIYELGEIQNWNTSAVTDMSAAFSNTRNNVFGTTNNTTSFNEDLSGWNTAAVTDMSSMFYFASAFGGGAGMSPLTWDTGKVEDMSFMFFNAPNFNLDISSWDTGDVENMRFTFGFASNFNQDISGWDVTSVQNMEYMFYRASNFNQNLEGWELTAITSASALGNIFNGDGIVMAMNQTFSDGVATDSWFQTCNTLAGPTGLIPNFYTNGDNYLFQPPVYADLYSYPD